MARMPNNTAETITTEIVNLDKGDSVQVTRFKAPKYRTAPFYGMGRKGYTKFFNPITTEEIFIDGFDFTGVCTSLTPVALSLFWKLASMRDSKTNVVNVSQKSLKESDRNRLKKFSKELIDKELICKMKRGYLLINPKALLPEYTYYESVEARWNQLKIEHLNNAKRMGTADKPTEDLKISLSSFGVMDSPIEFDDQEDDLNDRMINNELTLTL